MSKLREDKAEKEKESSRRMTGKIKGRKNLSLMSSLEEEKEIYLILTHHPIQQTKYET